MKCYFEVRSSSAAAAAPTAAEAPPASPLLSLVRDTAARIQQAAAELERQCSIECAELERSTGVLVLEVRKRCQKK